MARTHDHKEILVSLVMELAQANLVLEVATETYNTKKAELEAQLEPLKTAKDEQTARVNELREKIKAEGLFVEKTELPAGVTVQENTEITFDEAEMFQWCVMFNPSLLELNKSNITQHVNWILNLKSQTRRYFGTDGKKPLVPMPVTVEKVQAIEIKKDLSGWLPVPDPNQFDESPAVDGGEVSADPTPAVAVDDGTPEVSSAEQI